MTVPLAGNSRRTQAERRDATRAQLMDAARALFVAKGYADTGTPEIVAAANVTRGALYHHFVGKTELFRAVCIREAEAVGRAIDAATLDLHDAGQALRVGAVAYLDAMNVPGRSRLLLLDVPAVLGHGEAGELTLGEGHAQLREGLAQALPSAGNDEIDATADILSAAFDRTALAIAQGGDRTTYVNAMLMILERAMAHSSGHPN
ncbi:TetR/AcrR family transcriptional regulator [uncultured Jannaschia sp.]|uniref:TetR/AcrR family transcriptional regulator n=1 Tax=uncultured Jannaschia sp. TaxID=293347 RepID=UPI002631741B|nr:TetR/AcrR family transcriptional regulator [uncultured Jannaschia sp.]